MATTRGRRLAAVTTAAILGLLAAATAGIALGTASTPGAGPSGPRSGYAFCAPCHRPDGMGVAGMAPPLVGSRRLLADPRQAVAIVLAGFDSQGDAATPRCSAPMPSLAHLPDSTLADALTSARSSWGNRAPAIPALTVAGARLPRRRLPWTPAELARAFAP